MDKKYIKEVSSQIDCQQTRTTLSHKLSRNSSIDRKRSKSPKSVQDRRTARKDSVSSDDSGTSGYSTPNNEGSEMDGIYQPLANLQYALHTVLSEKNEEEKRRADQILKGDSNKILRDSLKLERVKAAQMFATLFDNDVIQSNCDVPQIEPFNKRKTPCSHEEFDRHFRGITKNYPRFEGKCVEILYFLIEIQALRANANITDDQLVKILQSRFSGRLRQYFTTELKREKNVVRVLNNLSPNYAETVDVSSEIEKCATFKFRFKNIEEELIGLKEIMSLAYPNLSTELFRETYVQKIIDKLPSQVRLEAVEIFEQQRVKERLGFKPLQDHETMKIFVKLCKKLESKQKKGPVFQVNCSESDVFEEDE